MFNFLKRKPLIVEVSTEKPVFPPTEHVLADLKQLPHRDGFKYILQTLRFEKAVMLAHLADKDNPDLRADVRAITRLEAKLTSYAQMDVKKPRPAEDEEMRIFKQVLASTSLV
jgi:hypothetical protein